MDLVYICMKFHIIEKFSSVIPINPFLAKWNFTFHLVFSIVPVFVNTGVGEIVLHYVHVFLTTSAMKSYSVGF